MARDPDSTHALSIFNDNPTLRDEANRTPSLALLSTALETVAIDGKIYFVAEGDLLLDTDELAAYALKRDSPARALELGYTNILSDNNRLVGMTENGKLVRWPEGTTLTYCIDKASFQNAHQYEEVVANMKAATGAWEAICDVHYEHKQDLDVAGASRKGLIFQVTMIDAMGRFYAAAFFPNSPQARRVVHIDPSYFGSHSYDRVGVLRHELGHTIGFRHEHILSGAPPDCPKEPLKDTELLTKKYDPKSVMHYFCGGVGSRELKISPLDIEGAQKLYGPPKTR